jgi:hypothetical protein
VSSSIEAWEAETRKFPLRARLGQSPLGGELCRLLLVHFNVHFTPTPAPHMYFPSSSGADAMESRSNSPYTLLFIHTFSSFVYCLLFLSFLGCPRRAKPILARAKEILPIKSSSAEEKEKLLRVLLIKKKIVLVEKNHIFRVQKKSFYPSSRIKKNVARNKFNGIW